VRVLRATRQNRRCRQRRSTAGLPSTAELLTDSQHLWSVPISEVCSWREGQLRISRAPRRAARVSYAAVPARECPPIGMLSIEDLKPSDYSHSRYPRELGDRNVSVTDEAGRLANAPGFSSQIRLKSAAKIVAAFRYSTTAHLKAVKCMRPGA